MDYKKLDEIAEKLESKYLPESAKGNEEAKEILAITQAYRIMSVKAGTSNEGSGLHLQRVSGSLLSDDKTKIMDKIITSYDYPPIPLRDYDWSAIREDYEPGDLIGTGRTEQNAKDDLVRQENER